AQLGRAFGEAECLEEALPLLQHAIELAPEDSYVREHFGWICARLGREEGIPVLVGLLTAAPSDGRTARDLVDLLEKRGELAARLREWRDCLESDDAEPWQLAAYVSGCSKLEQMREVYRWAAVWVARTGAD